MSLTCTRCEKSDATVERRRRNTQYANDEDNFVVSCWECFCDEHEFWEEQWADYYAGQGRRYTPTSLRVIPLAEVEVLS